MAKTQKGNFDKPDETRPFAAHGKMEVVKLGDGVVGKGVFEPGWRWSQDVKPIAKTESCQVHHLGYIISGRMRIKMDDGTETELGPGDVMDIEPGHDGWTVGDEPCVALEFGGAVQYAKS